MPTKHDLNQPHRTLQHPHSVTGLSLFLAAPTTLTIHPAPPKTGIIFQRTDLPGSPTIPAHIHNVLPATRHTVIAANPQAITPKDLHPATARQSTQPIVHTTEHILSALNALGITDAIITLNSPETPILDGSSQPFLPPRSSDPSLPSSPQPHPSSNTTRSPITITTPIILTFDEHTSIEAHPPAPDQPPNTTRYEYHLAYSNFPPPHPCPIPPQSVSIDIPFPPLPPSHNTTSQPPKAPTPHRPGNSFPGSTTNFANPTPQPQSSTSPLHPIPHQHLTDYATEVAPARTFSFEHEAQAARAMGLFQHLSPQDMLVIGPSGPIQNTYRFPNEPARHKLLDLIGDLALTQQPIAAHIIAKRTGHTHNHILAKTLLPPPQPLPQHIP